MQSTFARPVSGNEHREPILWCCLRCWPFLAVNGEAAADKRRDSKEVLSILLTIAVSTVSMLIMWRQLADKGRDLRPPA